MNEQAKRKLRGAIYGHLVADAVGTSYEFKSPGNIPPFDQIDMIPPVGYKKSWSAFDTGIWSDDGSQTLCLLEYYIERTIEQKDVDPDLGAPAWHVQWANKLIEWSNGHLWVGNHAFDGGMQTMDAIQQLKVGKHPLMAATNNEYSNGNGSLMRALPTAFFCYDWKDEDFFQEVENISHLTHPHPRSKLTCVFYCEIARELLRGNPLGAAIEFADERIRRHYTGDLLEEYENHVWEGYHVEPQGSGYVVNAFWSAIHALRSTDNYRDCIKTCIEFGNDTDTTACIAGGLAGIIYGYDGIPADWLEHLKSKEVVDELLERTNGN